MTPKQLAQLHFKEGYYGKLPYKRDSLKRALYIAERSRLIWADAFSQPKVF